MAGYLDRDHFDALQDARAEHAIETGEPMTLAEAFKHSRRGHRRTADGHERVSAAVAVPSSEDPIHGRPSLKAGRDGRDGRPQSTGEPCETGRP